MNRYLKPLQSLDDIGAPRAILDVCKSYLPAMDNVQYYDHRKQNFSDQIITLVGENVVLKVAFGNTQDRLKKFVQAREFLAENLKGILFQEILSFDEIEKGSVLALKKIDGRIACYDDFRQSNRLWESFLDLSAQLAKLSGEAKSPILFNESYTQKSNEQKSISHLNFNESGRWLMWPKLETNNIILSDKGEVAFLNFEKIGFFSSLEMARQIVRYIQFLLPQWNAESFSFFLDETQKVFPQMFASKESLLMQMIYFCDNAKEYSFFHETHQNVAGPFLKKMEAQLC